jgi:5-methylthioadenosine/S-adenosylhomocysteine deaminase
MATVVLDGLLCIEQNRIAYVGQASDDLPSDFAGAPLVETNGTIFPGLIELHNHPGYNAVPLWDVPTKFPNRKVWRADANYKRRVVNPATLLTHDPTSENARAVIRFVECRALLGGVTTTQGLSVTYMDPSTKAAYAGLVRNLELPDDPTWPTAEDQINDFTSYDEAKKRYGPFLGDMSHPFIMHLAEGTDSDAHDVFGFLRAPDGTWLIGKNLIGIHATALDAGQFQSMVASGGLVWSPLSNLLLYGATTKVEAAAAAGVSISIGSDWAPSGTKNLLGELKIAKLVSDNKEGLFTDQELVQMVTSNPAAMVGWDGFLGSIEPTKIADLLVLEGMSSDPYSQLVSAIETDIVAVLIDGRPRAGRATIIDPTTAGVEMIRVARQDLVLDLVENPNHPLAKTTLGNAIAVLSYSLEHLPDLASRFTAQHKLMEDSGQRLFVHLEMDEEHARALAAGEKAIGPGDVDPMELDPITEADDNSFRPRLKANLNLPDWLREKL